MRLAGAFLALATMATVAGTGARVVPRLTRVVGLAKELISEDVAAVFARDPAAKSVPEVILCYPGLHAIWFHRLAHYLYCNRHYLAARWISHWTRWLTGIEIHPGARIGRRCFIDHGSGVVIGETTEIGDDALIYQGVTLGGVSLAPTKRHPTLGNRVSVGAGAKILGPIEIGDDAVVGAGSVVVRPVPPGTRVVGIPARAVDPRPVRPQRLDHGNLPDPVARVIEALVHRLDHVEHQLHQLTALTEGPDGQPGEEEEDKRVIDRFIGDNGHGFNHGAGI